MAEADSARMSQMIAGFIIFQALYVVAKLDIPTILAEGPRPAAELAAMTGAHPGSLRRLLRSLVSEGLFYTADDGAVGVTPLGLALADGQPGSVRDLTLMWGETHYAPFGEFLHTVRTGQPGAEWLWGKSFFDHLREDPERAALFSRAMGSLSASARTGLFDGYWLPAAPDEVVADIGGADGSVLAMLLEREPGRVGIVFDRPEAVPQALRSVAARGLPERMTVTGGDFFEAVPSAGTYLLSLVLHDWDDAACARILATIGTCAPAGARLLIIEAVVSEGDVPEWVRLSDLVMLGTLSGRERTAAEFTALLDGSPFVLDRIVPTPTRYCILETSLR